MDDSRKINARLIDLKTKLADSALFRGGFHALESGDSVTFDGLVGNASLLLASVLAEKSGKLLVVICPNVGEVEKAADDLALFTDAPILTYPVLPSVLTGENVTSDEIFLSEDRIFGDRLRVLKELEKRSRPDFGLPPPNSDKIVTGKGTSTNRLGAMVRKLRQVDAADSAEPKPKFTPPPTILVTSLAALRQPVPTRQEMTADSRVIEVGKEYDREELIRWLLEGGGHPTSAVELPGEYSVRGGILDLFAIDWTQPIRVEFFGDEIESIRPFEIKTQRSEGNLNSILLTRLRPSVNVTGRFADHLPIATIPFLIETDRILQQASKLDGFFVHRENREKEREPETGKGSEPQKGAPASSVSVISIAETLNALYRFPTAHAVSVASGNELSLRTFSFGFRSVERFQGNLQTVRDEIDSLAPTERIGIVCRTEAEVRRIRDALSPTAAARTNRIFWLTGTFARGFEWPEENLVLIGTEELFGRMNIRRSKARPASEAIDSFVDLKPGDLVIHVGHGLAKFRGLKTITKGQQEEEHLELEFDDNVVLYVPASKIGLIQKYVGTSKSRPKLAKLNGKAWGKQKKEVQAAVFDLAMDMLDLQAKREALHGITYPPDSDWQRDFDESFPFDETEDQLLAIESIKNDMERHRPMDRLLCGDVGFGKTEVAVRAAFKAIDAGYQVAVLVPTTILAEQHYRVFSERMAAFPVKVGILSRFCGKKEIAETIEKIKKGEIDIVIGTHRLVQKDIEFKNLGLVVIDEEQRFGVKDKEHLKKLRSLVDVLTMTATPIPRTLHFSLLGLRDISNLQTPPSDRLPIETKVMRFSAASIRKGILYEISRGGQVFFLHNRVNDIDEMAARLREIVPEARVAVGHAQMSDDELEEVMRGFLHHRFDVLLSTTIIESGLDIPNANTIFIDHANRFGLAELHQLRGRVGRYKNQAYCYLLLAPNAPMTTESMKRLRAIEEYSHLGAGFQLALRDLELRGAGNILGTQQSGHINLVGYEMYCEFLESAVRLLKNQPQKIKIELEIDLPGTASIPKDYIPETRDKIDVYRRLTRVTTHDECESIANELADRFGPLPVTVKRLLLCSEIRVAAWRHSFRSIQLTEGPDGPYIGLTFMSEDLVRKLKAGLAEKRIALRIVNANRAYIPVPKSILDVENHPDPDSLLHFVLTAMSIETEYRPTA